MIKNLFLVALRNFNRDRGYSFLNILGLSIEKGKIFRDQKKSGIHPQKIERRFALAADRLTFVS